mmetsp:Transcript_35578/g.79011  ORF Transcript_35578/g.79011 Transcript_35578/m.79011 type:complete len:727 (-) Transcript_35578:712-2892(-)
MWGFFSVSMVGIMVAIVFLVRHFAAKTVSIVVKIATAYAWLTAMMVIALVPIDVWAAKDFASSTGGILILWFIAFGSTQLATWLVLPFYQVYSEAGDFTVGARSWTSLKENAILYISVGVLGGIGIGVLLALGTLDVASLLTWGVFLSNTFGLFCCLLLLGYGLVEIPKELWLKSNPETSLKWCAHRVGKFAQEVMKTTKELDTVVAIIHANEKQMRRTDPLRKYMDIIVQKAERDSPVKPSQITNVELDGLSAEELEYNYDIQGMAQLRRRMKSAVADYQGARQQYEEAMLEAFELEDIIKCRSLKDYNPRVPEGVKPKPWVAPIWKYKCIVRPFANKVFAIILGLTSLAIIFAEATIPALEPDLSPFSHIVRGAEGAFGTQLMTILPLVYICACSYFALFKINAFNYNKLIAKATTGAALMQNGSLMCRFAAPTCWNFYHMIRYASDYCDLTEEKAGTCQNTVFSSKIMGSMNQKEDSPIKLPNFNVYVPVVLGVHSFMVATGIWQRLLNMCVSSRYMFTTDDVDDVYTEKGRLLIRKEQEATLKGYRIGEVLHSAYFDLEFPDIAGLRNKGKKKGLFGGLFNKKSDAAAAATFTPAPPAGQRYNSAAAMNAARWVRPGGTPEVTPKGSTNTLDALAENPTTSLLASRGAADTGATTTAGGGKSSALDGIFASLGTSKAAAPAATAGPAGGATSGATQGTRLVIGPATTGAATKETDSLLGRWL